MQELSHWPAHTCSHAVLLLHNPPLTPNHALCALPPAPPLTPNPCLQQKKTLYMLPTHRLPPHKPRRSLRLPGIYLCMLALLQPGDHVVVTYPGYQSLYAVAESLGCQVSHWEPSVAAGGGMEFDVEQLKVGF